MIATRVLTDYFEAAMGHAVMESIEDGTYVGRIDGCPGLLSFGASEPEALEDLRITLEDWVLAGLKLGAVLPSFGGIDLNGGPRLEPVDSLQTA